nr:immunoglobulin heavy chain junction region [Mus musculus]MBK4196210.1 immunoglobulin heavy chain junction region [Mus musculus]MBK4196211.1 immunoglobulin heavy chain junction region [Mus musculus]MBK4196213.1 immunoglobulin heavy chain junction region [Mus musculus]MBK4196214.1 immunoglobulin heavy chain junction region [Mus musculus]
CASYGYDGYWYFDVW